LADNGFLGLLISGEHLPLHCFPLPEGLNKDRVIVGIHTGEDFLLFLHQVRTMLMAPGDGPAGVVGGKAGDGLLHQMVYVNSGIRRRGEFFKHRKRPEHWYHLPDFPGGLIAENP
jgi:hypothetical protein